MVLQPPITHPSDNSFSLRAAQSSDSVSERGASEPASGRRPPSLQIATQRLARQESDQRQSVCGSKCDICVCRLQRPELRFGSNSLRYMRRPLRVSPASRARVSRLPSVLVRCALAALFARMQEYLVVRSQDQEAKTCSTTVRTSVVHGITIGKKTAKSPRHTSVIGIY